MTQDTRIEKDTMGEMVVPSAAYYGAQTARAVENFPISGLRLPRRMLSAMGLIKMAAAETNVELGLLDPKVGKAIVEAAREVADGKLDSEFPIDIFQTGSGTSSNMNANEVIANRAAELLGGHKGDKKLVHPNDHVNLCQSSNDVIPTAVHLAALTGIEEELIPALTALRGALEEKSQEFMPIIKTGRTHLQDATPIRLGQEFKGYAGQAERAVRRLRYAVSELSELALGGTAVGTGVNSHPEFASRVCKRLSAITGLQLTESDNHFQSQNTLDGIVFAHGTIAGVAISLSKVANDMRWLGSGPRAGFGEITLPEVQPGSSIMPGKVNPVIAEALLMACAQVVGNNSTVIMAGQGGYFELNMMMPVAAHDLVQSISILSSATDNFVKKLVVGLKATQKGPEMVEKGLAIATALAPVIGYDAAAGISKEAHKTGETIREVAKRRTQLSDQELDKLLDPASMTEPGLEGGPAAG